MPGHFRPGFQAPLCPFNISSSHPGASQCPKEDEGKIRN
jgi:hypothetical protein